MKKTNSKRKKRNLNFHMESAEVRVHTARDVLPVGVTLPVYDGLEAARAHFTDEELLHYINHAVRTEALMNARSAALEFEAMYHLDPESAELAPTDADEHIQKIDNHSQRHH